MYNTYIHIYIFFFAVHLALSVHLIILKTLAARSAALTWHMAWPGRHQETALQDLKEHPFHRVQRGLQAGQGDWVLHVKVLKDLFQWLWVGIPSGWLRILMNLWACSCCSRSRGEALITFFRRAACHGEGFIKPNLKERKNKALITRSLGVLTF